MDSKEQIQFVTDLTNAVRDKVIERIEKGKIPETWDGIELRWLLRDKFENEVLGDYGYGNKKRKREYNNTVLVENI